MDKWPYLLENPVKLHSPKKTPALAGQEKKNLVSSTVRGSVGAGPELIQTYWKK